MQTLGMLKDNSLVLLLTSMMNMFTVAQKQATYLK